MKLVAEDCIKVDERLFLFCREYNLFYSIDLNTYKITLEGSIPNQQFQQSQLCRRMIFYNNEIYFIPYNMDSCIYIYRLFEKTWRTIPIEEEETNTNKALFLQAIMVEDNLFLFGGNYSKIIKLNLCQGSIDYINIFDEKVNNNDVFFRGNYLKKGEVYWFPSSISNRILEFNPKSLEYRWITVGNKKDIYSAICWDGSSYWLAPRRNGDILRWDGKDNLERFPLPKEYHKIDNVYFVAAVSQDNSILFPALHSNLSLVLNKYGCDMRIEQNSYSFVKMEENILYKFDLESNLYIDECEKIQCDVPSIEFTKYLSDRGITYRLSKIVNAESEEMPLSLFLNSF